MNVLSLFDGIACGMVTLQRTGIQVNSYYASETDAYCIRTAQHNYPGIIQAGDVRHISYKNGTLYTENGNFHTDIDMVIGGSPCQGFSFAGKQLNFNDPRSRLFFEFERIVKEVRPEYFLFENVTMKEEFMDVITKHLGVAPVLLNSAMVSAAVRRRLYWTNIPSITQPADCGITFGDIRERGVTQKNMYYTQKALAWIKKYQAKSGKQFRIISDDSKMPTLEASMYKKYSQQRFFGIEDIYGIRYITPLECERCMNLPDRYTICCSDTQRYKQVGNAWECNMLTHIFSNIKAWPVKGDGKHVI